MDSWYKYKEDEVIEFKKDILKQRENHADKKDRDLYRASEDRNGVRRTGGGSRPDCLAATPQSPYSYASSASPSPWHFHFLPFSIPLWISPLNNFFFFYGTILLLSFTLFYLIWVDF